MPNPDEDMQGSMAAHKAGRFADAEAGYQRVLRARPEDPKALYYLGLLHFHRGDTTVAIDLVRRSLARAPSTAAAWNTLGGLYIAIGNTGDAREAYRRMTQVAPSLGEGWYNLGICLRDEGDVDGALSALQTSVEREPGFFRSYEALATLLYRAGRTSEAAGVYSDWARLDPENPTARHMAAATSQQDVPARAADDYVRALFDESAKSFDEDLTRLGYRAPTLLADALTQLASERSPSRGLEYRVLCDAGCGTGLCGPLVRGLCGRLVGIDLSPQMIDRARARKCYDELQVVELSAFMRAKARVFDAIVCADTLVYFGALEEALQSMRQALTPGGVLVFTLEALDPEHAADDFRLEAHGRYAHSAAYVDRALTEAGFEVLSLSVETLREERDQPVEGFVVVASGGPYSRQ